MEGFWLEQGWYRIERGGWELTPARWREAGDELRREAVRFLVEEVLCKDPRDVSQKDFRAHRLSGLLSRYYRKSPWRAVSDAFPELDIKPWEMKVTPPGFFDDIGNRVDAVRWLVERTCGDPRLLGGRCFHASRLTGLRDHQYGGSTYAAVCEAYPELDIEPWEMAKMPMGFYDEAENRTAAVRWLVETTGKDPRDLRQSDFGAAGFWRLIAVHGGSPRRAVQEAFPELDIGPEDMKYLPLGYYARRDNRVKAIRGLVDKLGIDPRELGKNDFNDAGLAGLLNNRYGGSPYQAVSEGFPELAIRPWEMAVTPQRLFDSADNRVAAVRWLVDKTGKVPQQLTTRDFYSHGLSVLICHKYGSSPWAAVTEAFPELDIKAWEMSKTPQGYFKVKRRRVAAVRWLVDVVGGRPIADDFASHGLSGLLWGYYGASPAAALREARRLTARGRASRRPSRAT
jgi:hypothetical protein